MIRRQPLFKSQFNYSDLVHTSKTLMFNYSDYESKITILIFNFSDSKHTRIIPMFINPDSVHTNYSTDVQLFRFCKYKYNTNVFDRVCICKVQY